MREIQKLYYRSKGLRYSEQLIGPPTFLFEKFPKYVVFHHLPDDIRFPDVGTEERWFQEYQKKIILENVIDYVQTKGPVRRPMFNMTEATRSWRQANRSRWTVEEAAYLSNQNPETLIVLNYGYLDIVHKYLPVRLADYWRWENRQRTLYSKINEIAKKSDRNQYLFYPTPAVIQGRTVLDKYSTEEPTNRMEDIFGQAGDAGYWQLDLWRWLSVENRNRSLLNLIDPKNYVKVNFVFQNKQGQNVLINLAYLDAWIKGQPNTTDVSSLIQHAPRQIQNYFLKFLMSLNSLNVEEDSTGEVVIPDQPSFSTVRKPDPILEKEPSEVAIAEGDVDDTSLVDDIDIPEDEDNEAFETVGAAEVRVGLQKNSPNLNRVSEPEPLKPMPSFSKEILQDLEKDLEALDRISLVQLKNKGIRLDEKAEVTEEEETPEVYIDPEEVKKKVFTPTSASERLRSWLDEDASANILTAAEYRKYNNLLQEYRESLNPYNEKEKRLDAMVKKTEDLVLSPDLIQVKDTPVVPDKTMLSSSLKAFNKQYLKKVHRKDILSAIDAVQAAGVAVRRHEVDITHSALGSYENHVLELAPIDGKPSSIKFTLPVVDDEGTFMAGGNKYLLRTQRVDVPIRKIAPTIVGLSTYYGKTFVQTSPKATNNSLRWIFSKINDAALTADGYIHSVNPANVFDPYFEAPKMYNALASEYDQFSVGSNRLYFDHRSRHEKVNPELLKLIERKGRIWCGWTKDTSPIVIDPNNQFFVLTKNGETELGSVYDFFKLPEEKAPVDFAEIRIFSKYVPVGVVMAYYLGFDALVALLGAEARVVPTRKNKQLQPDEFAIPFKDQSVIFKTHDERAKLVLAGFLDYDKITKLYDREEFNHKAVYLNLLMTKRMSAIYIKELDMMDAAYIDPISAEILAKMNEPTTFQGLVLRAVEMLQSYTHPTSQDRAAMRDRGYERFAGTVYKEVMQAIRQYRNRNVSGRSKIEMSPYQVWNAIMKDNSLKVVEDINPIQNLKESEVVTYSGTGGRDKDSMTKPTRAMHKNDLGVTSESSVDNSAVGTIVYMSANPQLGDVRGLIKEDKELSPTSMMSTSALISPASSHDN